MGREHRKTCGSCGQQVYGDYKSFKGTYWHRHCFRCWVCDKLIESDDDLPESELILLGYRYLCHLKCCLQLQDPQCDVCHQPLPANKNGTYKCLRNFFWQEKYCLSHEDDGTPACFSCHRFVQETSKPVTLEDGRSLCMECHEFAIMDTNECQPLYREIRGYFQSIDLEIKQRFPMLLVEHREFAKATKGEKPDDMYEGVMGMCVSKRKIVNSVHRSRKIRRNTVLGWEEYMGIESHPHDLDNMCRIKGILVLYGLPRLMTGSILAHELMHAWLRLNIDRKVNRRAEEGVCELLANMWLESQVMPKAASLPPPPPPLRKPSAASDPSLPSNPTSPPPPEEAVEKSDVFEKKLGEYYMFEKATRGKDVYGEGFRAAKAAVKKFGLKGILQFIRWTGSFPVPIRSAL